MNYINELMDIKSLCRICLTQSKNVISLATSIENTDSENNPLIIEALEEVMGGKIIWGNSYPDVICPMCLGLLRISYDFKNQFRNTEKMLHQHFSSDMADYESLDDQTGNVTKSLKTNSESLAGVANETSTVELIVGSNKYSLKDILIVEDEMPNHGDYKGFLKNLGKTVSAQFVTKSKPQPKSLVEEEPILLIEKLFPENVGDVENISVSNKDSIDQYIITQDNHPLAKNSDINVFKDNLKMENLTDLDKEIIKNALNMQLKCDICGKLYLSQARYRRHLEKCSKLQTRVVNENGIATIKHFLLQCNLCSRTFKQKKFFNYHVKTTHSSDPSKYKCEICGQILHNRNRLMYHKLTKHGERKFDCNICDKKFFTSDSLKKHVLGHMQEKIPQCVCPICGKTFHYNGGLFYHMKSHTNDRKYCCDFCDRKFYTLNSKKRHTLTHTRIRPYACKYCEKCFFSIGEVRKHEYIHTGERPHSCQYCGKGFYSTYNMKLHFLSHPGPYPCKFCDKTFVSMSILQYHHKIKHSSTDDLEDNLLLDNH